METVTTTLLEIRQQCLKWALDQHCPPSLLYIVAEEYYEWIVNGTVPKSNQKAEQINS